MTYNPGRETNDDWLVFFFLQHVERQIGERGFPRPPRALYSDNQAARQIVMEEGIRKMPCQYAETKPVLARFGDRGVVAELVLVHGGVPSGSGG